MIQSVVQMDEHMEIHVKLFASTLLFGTEVSADKVMFQNTLTGY